MTNCSAFNSIAHGQNDLLNNEEAKVPIGISKEVSNFNLMSFLANLKKSLESTLVYFDKFLYKEYKKIEIVSRKRELKNVSSQDSPNYDGSQNMTETLTNIIRRSSLRKRKLLNEEIECRSQSVGKQWSESLKYSKVENKKTLREIRIAAELRDVLLSSFDNTISNLVLEIMKPNSKFISNNERFFSARKLLELDSYGSSLGLYRGRNDSMSSFGGGSFRGNKKKSVDSLLYNSVNKSLVYNSTTSAIEKKKPKNLNDYILKKV